MTPAVEETGGVGALELEFIWLVTKELEDLSHVIVIFVVPSTLLGFKQLLARDQLEDDTAQRPNVDDRTIVLALDDLGRSILSRLDVVCCVSIDPASVSHIADQEPERVDVRGSGLTTARRMRRRAWRGVRAGRRAVQHRRCGRRLHLVL